MSDTLPLSAPCMWMRGGTSKAAFFLAGDLPDSIRDRDAFLLRIMGSPDSRQIDGIGGADPLTSKVAVIRKSSRPGIDVDYLFLQVSPDQPIVSDTQNCGNILAAVGPFAIERGLVKARNSQTTVQIYMENTGQSVMARVETPSGILTYDGDTRIDGVPGCASPVALTFRDVQGSSCGALLPTGQPKDIIDAIEVTCIDAGMPTVIIRAADMGLTGAESREELDGNKALKERLERIRLQTGPMMNLGDVHDKTVPKMTLVSPARHGTISTRTFIPHRCHASIGVLGSVSIATACMTTGTVAANVATIPSDTTKPLTIEHPIGQNDILVTLNDKREMEGAAVLRTTRKLFDGVVFAGPEREDTIRK